VVQQMFSVNDKVYWVIKPRADKLLERAGVIIAVVEAERHPNSCGFGMVVAQNVYVRNETSYLVRIPGTKSIFWLSDRILLPLPIEKDSLLTTQKPAQQKALFVDKSDRIKIKKLCRQLDLDFTESRDFVHVPGMHKRFVFHTMCGVEFICAIEYIKDL